MKSLKITKDEVVRYLEAEFGFKNVKFMQKTSEGDMQIPSDFDYIEGELP